MLFTVSDFVIKKNATSLNLVCGGTKLIENLEKKHRSIYLVSFVQIVYEQFSSCNIH